MSEERESLLLKVQFSNHAQHAIHSSRNSTIACHFQCFEILKESFCNLEISLIISTYAVQYIQQIIV